VRTRYDRCLRCGTRVAWGQSVCRRCNPAGLPTPSPSQYHGTVMLAVLVGVAMLVLLLVLTGR
jgi:hypothetical protein